MRLSNREKVILRVFRTNYVEGSDEVPFTLDDIRDAVEATGYEEKNVPDLLYQFRSGRAALPVSLTDQGFNLIRGRGKGKYVFLKLTRNPEVDLPSDLAVIPIPDATPEIVLEYAGSDEQGLLAKVLYNRLIDCFLGLTCYHLQNHWRTTLKDQGQIEVDAVYVGLDKKGRHYVIPVEAKSSKGRISRTQILQNIDFARERYPNLIVRPIGAQESPEGAILLIEFQPADHPDNILTLDMKCYQLVPMDEIPIKEIQSQCG